LKNRDRGKGLECEVTGQGARIVFFTKQLGKFNDQMVPFLNESRWPNFRRYGVCNHARTSSQTTQRARQRINERDDFRGWNETFQDSPPRSRGLHAADMALGACRVSVAAYRRGPRPGSPPPGGETPCPFESGRRPPERRSGR